MYTHTIIEIVNLILGVTQVLVVVVALAYSHKYLTAVGLRMSVKSAEQVKEADLKLAGSNVIYLNLSTKRQRGSIRAYAPHLGDVDLHTPDFNGKAHQVLGIGMDSNTKIIVAAHRHWVSEYHPDKVIARAPQEVQEACVRCQQLNEAKEKMLFERKLKRKAA